MKSLFILAVFLCISALIAKETFKGHSLVKIKIDDENEFKRFSKVFPLDAIDRWTGMYAPKHVMEIRFTAQQMKILADMFFTKNPIRFSNFKILLKDLGKVVKDEQTKIENYKKELVLKTANLKTKKQMDDVKYSMDEWYKSYHDLEENMNFLDHLVQKYPTMVDKEVIGNSVEGRPIVLLRVHAPGAYDPSKPSLFMTSLMHAREWITPGTGQYFIQKLLVDYRPGSVLQGLNIHYIAVVNPDGFLYTHTTNRFWRKSRRVNAFGARGVDLNRNWKSGFGGSGSSSNPFSDTYRGPSAYSEPEVKCIVDYLEKYRGQIKAGIDIHSYSQLNLRPWGKVRGVTPDESVLKTLGDRMMRALNTVWGFSYRNIRASELYVAGGVSGDDWYEYQGFPAFVYELRPVGGGLGGFAPAADQILPCAEENFAATMVLAKEIAYTKQKNVDAVIREFMKNF